MQNPSRVDETLRIVSARTTERIARRWGRYFPMWIGCGYPKSGTVWLCKLLSNYLGVPYPQNYRLPIAMSSVIHAHWGYHERLPPTAYIYRDGRDVMVSLYFHQMRELASRRNPGNAARTQERMQHLFGAGFDPNDVRGNLPRFIDHEFTEQRHGYGTWSDHVVDWCLPTRPNVAYVSYEALTREPESTFAELISTLTQSPASPEKVRLALEREDFSLVSGRARGSEDRSSFLRKGTAGAWRSHFDRAAAEVFDHHAGDALVTLGYAEPGWSRTVGT